LTYETYKLKKQGRVMTDFLLFLRIRSTSLGALACALALCVLIKSAPAQTSQDLDRAQLLGAPQPSVGPVVTTTGVEDGHVVASPNDPDLGEQQILKHAEAYEPFTVSVGVPFYWTSNVALSNSGEESDLIVAPSVGVSYEHRFSKTLHGSVGVSEQLFYYDRFSEFDFGSFNVGAGLRYLLPELHNLTLSAQYNYNRLTFDDSFEDFFSNHSLTFAADLPFRIGRNQGLSVGLLTNVSLAADPEPPRRSDFEAYVSYSLALSRSLSLSASGRIVLREYHDTSRTDVSEVLALSATYRIMKYFSASAISSFAANQSSQGVFDYEVANLGAAVSFAIRF
jgi:hypothetical protein